MTAPAGVQERTTVTVGYDGSKAAEDAVRWAAGYAAAGNYRLRVVHARVWPLFRKKLGPVPGVNGRRHSAESILADGVTLARTVLVSQTAAVPTAEPAVSTVGTATEAVIPALVVETATAAAPDGPPADTPPATASETGTGVEGLLEPGFPAPVLRDAAGDARLLVIGSRSRGGVLGQLAGPVCRNLAATSPCPLLIIRRLRIARQPLGPVVVGIDGTSRSSEALAGAARLASVLGWPLRIVHIDRNPGGTGEGNGRHRPLRGQALLNHALEEARNPDRQLSISVDLRKGHAASKELLAAASDAEVLVIGTHNREDGLGNTVTAVLNQARCNVLITR